MIRIEWWRSPRATGEPLGRGRRSKPRICPGRRGTAVGVAAAVVAGVVVAGVATLGRECFRRRPAVFAVFAAAAAAAVVVDVVVAVAVVAAAAALVVGAAVALRVLPSRTTTLGIRRVRAWAIEGRRSGQTAVRACPPEGR